MAREKQITRAMEVTECKTQMMKIVKTPDENGNIPIPITYEVDIDLLGTWDKMQALNILRANYETHSDKADRIFINVNAVKHCWQLRSIGISSFFANSHIISESDTFEGLRGKSTDENEGE